MLAESGSVPKDNPLFRDHDIPSFDDREHVIPVP
jgi:hypothetical protein